MAMKKSYNTLLLIITHILMWGKLYLALKNDLTSWVKELMTCQDYEDPKLGFPCLFCLRPTTLFRPEWIEREWFHPSADPRACRPASMVPGKRPDDGSTCPVRKRLASQDWTKGWKICKLCWNSFYLQKFNWFKQR